MGFKKGSVVHQDGANIGRAEVWVVLGGSATLNISPDGVYRWDSAKYT
jgi:hypothetical protein